MDRRPPLAVSPRRLRPRRAPRSVPLDQTPPAAATKTQFPIRSTGFKEPVPRPEYQLISSELMDLAKRVDQDFGNNDDLGKALRASTGTCTSPLFERGRLYELYSAHRNERLKRKKGEIQEEMVAHNPGVAVELAKRRSGKKAEGLRKSVPAGLSVSRSSSLRSSVRSSKEMKKPSVAASWDKFASDAGRRIGTRSVRKNMN